MLASRGVSPFTGFARRPFRRPCLPTVRRLPSTPSMSRQTAPIRAGYCGFADGGPRTLQKQMSLLH